MAFHRELRLFQPGQIGKLTLRNRIVMPPMVTQFATDTGGVSEAHLHYLQERARGGVGLIIVEATCVDAATGLAFACGLRLDNERYVAGHSVLTEVVQSYGARIAVQLHHGGLHALPGVISGPPVAPSALPSSGSGATARALTQGEIQELVDKFGQAADRAKRAGYDAVELHGAHGYLLNQFLSPVTNQRRDEYGGSPQNRLRFSLEVISRVKGRAGRDFPLILRCSPEDGYGPEEAKFFAREWQKAGVDALHVSRPDGPALSQRIPPETSPMAYPQGWLVGYAEAIKRTVDIPVITVGEIREVAFAEEVLETGKADFVAIGRPLLADPEWPVKAREGRAEDIRSCISCELCRMRLRRSLPIRCMVNACLGRENRFPQLSAAATPKRVMVVGSGPAGMEAARVAALRGHRVDLYEREPHLGGLLNLAALPPHKGKISWLRQYLVNQIEKLGVRVHLHMEVDMGLVRRIAPEVLIVATGSRPIIPQVPGVQGHRVATALDVLSGKVAIPGKKVAVIGGRQTGCETAEFLAERGFQVCIVARSPASSLAEDIVFGGRNALLARLAKDGVEIITEHDIREIKPEGLTLVGPGDRERFLGTDMVVLARGALSERGLADQTQGLVPEIFTVGDAAQVANIAEAIYQGFWAGFRI